MLYIFTQLVAGDPNTTSELATVNEGAAGSQDYPRLYAGADAVRE